MSFKHQMFDNFWLKTFLLKIRNFASIFLDSQKTGTYRFRNGARYVGQYSQNQKHGKGIFYYPDGSVYDGDWNYDRKEGVGKYTYPNGDVYHGEWDHEERHGQGTYTFAYVSLLFLKKSD